MRQWFEQWGLPEMMQFDHGQPWGSGKADLPGLFPLWLVGLGVDVVWSRPGHPQDNGIVERSHRTTQAWSAPTFCRNLSHLQQSLDKAAEVQRAFYPTVSGQTRLQRFPQLLESRRPYCISQEPELWSLQRAYNHLSQSCWRRKVDGSGRISLYNRNCSVGRALQGQHLWVRFDALCAQWACFDENGVEVARIPALSIDTQVICQLQWRRSRAKRNPSTTGA